MVKLACLQSFPFHYELMGSFLEFAQTENFEIDLFIDTKTDPDMVNFYSSRFPLTKFIHYEKFHVPSSFLYYDKVVLLTDDDKFCKDTSVPLTMMPKMIIVRHVNYERVFNSLPVSSLYFTNWKNITLENSVESLAWKYINAKQKILAVGKTITVAIVGTMRSDWSVYDRVKQGTLGCKFMYFNRSQVDVPAGVETFFGLTDSELWKKLEGCTHILSTKNEMKSTGAIILAPSTLCQFIRPTQTHCHKGVYEINFEEHGPIVLTFPNFVELEKTREAIIDANNIKILKLLENDTSTFVEVEHKDREIPNVAHVMWLDRKSPTATTTIPEKYKKNIENFQLLNPETLLKLWGFREVIPLMKQTFSNELFTWWNTLPLVINKCDIARFVILQTEGGYYMDLDFYHVYPLTFLPTNCPFVCRELPEHEDVNQLYNGFVGCNKGNSFIKGWVDHMFATLPSKEMTGHEHVMGSTGPVNFWRFFELYQEKTMNPIELSNSSSVMAINNKHQISSTYDPKICPVAYSIWTEGTGWGIDPLTDEKNSKANSTESSSSFPLLIVIAVLGVILLVSTVTLSVLYAKKK